MLASQGEPDREIHGRVVVIVNNNPLLLNFFKGKRPRCDLCNKEFVNDVDDYQIKGEIATENDVSLRIFKTDVTQKMIP